MNNMLMNGVFERAFLGACLVDPEVYTQSNLSTTDFGTVQHQLIFGAIATVYEANSTCDPILVANQLEKEGELNRIGGSDYIYELQSVIVETESAPYYAKEIKKSSDKRNGLALLNKAIAQITESDIELEQVFAALEQNIKFLNFEQEQLESYTIAELAKREIEPVKWFIPDFLPSGLTILAGPPKIGKSFFCWNMALAVANGGCAFSSINLEEQFNVTYLSLEDSDALLQDRLELISPDIKPPNLHVVHDLHTKKLDAAGLKMMEAHLDKTDSDLLIVDTWKHVAPQLDIKGTSYDIDYESLIPIQRFAHRRNMGIVLVTHTRKAADIDNAFNQIQGSVGVQAACDTLMMLSHDSNTKTLHITGRRIPSDQFALTIENGIWQLEGNAQDYHKSELRKEIITLLLDAGDEGLSAGDLVDLTGKEDSNIRWTLRRMVKSGEIHQPRKRCNYFHNNYIEDDLDFNL